MKVLIIDDHVIVRQGISSVLASQPDIKVVGEAGSIHEGLALSHQLHPDVILMDYGLPDGNGVEATQAILAENPDIKIIFLTVHNDNDRLFAALHAGAKGYLLKDLSVSKLITSLRAIENKEAALSPDMTWRVIEEFSKNNILQQQDHSRLAILTLRELDILGELAAFSTNAEIANRLSLSEKTVKNHVHTILEKLQMKNRREAGWFAQEQGLSSKTRKVH